MFGSALYYPYIDIEDGKWLRSAILFWDEIQTIVPTSIKKPYKSKDTRICAEEGYLSPLPCDLHGDVLNQLGKRVINLVQNSEGPSDLDPFASNADPNSYALVHAHKFRPCTPPRASCSAASSSQAIGGPARTFSRRRAY